jgi:hypothetical protein
MASENSSIGSLGLQREIKRPTKHDGDEVAYIDVGRRIVSGSRRQKKDSDSDYNPDSASEEQCDKSVGSSRKAVMKNVDNSSKPDKRHAGPATADGNSPAHRFVGHGREPIISVCEGDREDEEEVLPRGPRVTRPSQPIPYKPFNPFKAAEPAVFPTKDRITEAPAVVGAATLKATLSVPTWISGAVKKSPKHNPPLTRPTPAQLRHINTAYNSLKQAQSDTKCLQYLGVTFTADGKPIHDLSVAVSKHLTPLSNPNFDNSHKPFPIPAADVAKRRARNQDAFQNLHPMLKNLIVSELLDDSDSELVASTTASAAAGPPAITMAVVEQLLGVERDVIEGAREEVARLREERAQDKSVPQRGDVVAALRWLAERGLPGSLVCLYSGIYDIDVSKPTGGEEMEKQDSGLGVERRDVVPKKRRRG